MGMIILAVLPLIGIGAGSLAYKYGKSADATAYSNTTIAQSLTPILVQQNLINKLAPTLQTMVLPSGINLFDINALLQPGATPTQGGGN